MIGIIDKFENDLAIIELQDKKFISISKSKLPPEAVEGCVIIIEENIIQVDFIQTQFRKEEIENLMKDLFE